MEEIIKNTEKMTFSGHNTFHCRHLWLKKGYDFVRKEKNFADEDSVVELGVGKNMVSAINFWMKAFGIIDKNNNLTKLAHYLFDDATGRDPYLEDEATLWLLHYHLVKNNAASIYNLIFNDFRREKIEFTRDNFLAFVIRKAEEFNLPPINKNTVNSDFEVFVKMYLRTDSHSKDKEDTFSGILTELNFLREENRTNFENKTTVSYFSVVTDEKTVIPDEIILYVILSSDGVDKSISLSTIEYEKNQVGSVFAINRSGLVTKLENIASIVEFKNYGITFNDHAGIKELQFKTKPNKFEILDRYYVN